MLLLLVPADYIVVSCAGAVAVAAASAASASVVLPLLGHTCDKNADQKAHPLAHLLKVGLHARVWLTVAAWLATLAPVQMEPTGASIGEGEQRVGDPESAGVCVTQRNATSTIPAQQTLNSQLLCTPTYARGRGSREVAGTKPTFVTARAGGATYRLFVSLMRICKLWSCAVFA